MTTLIQSLGAHSSHRRRNRPGSVTSGFSLIELMVSVALLAVLLLILEKVTDSVMRAWREGQARTDGFQSARTALEVMSRELSPAVVDTRLQFVVAPGTLLKAKGAPDVAPEAPDLRCVGYYLAQDPIRKFYRLKRISIGPLGIDGKDSPYFPGTVATNHPGEKEPRSSPIDANWFTDKWDDAAFDEEDPENEVAVVSSAADGVIGFWVQCRDVLGRPIALLSNAANHPKSELFYNSAAYFQVATTTPFENGESFIYLAETLQSMKANRVPASVELTIVTLDSAILNRGVTIPAQSNLFDPAGALDLDASVHKFQSELRQNHIYTARTFTTRAKLVNGS